MTNEECFKAAVADVEGTLGVTLYEGYSGRGMYGQRTVGAVGSRQAILVFLQVLGQRLAEEGKEPIRSLRTDNMGMDVILYIHR